MKRFTIFNSVHLHRFGSVCLGSAGGHCMILPFPAFIKSIAASFALAMWHFIQWRKRRNTNSKVGWGNALMFARCSSWRLCSTARLLLHAYFEREVTWARGWKTCFFSIERVDGRFSVTIILLCDSSIKSSGWREERI